MVVLFRNPNRVEAALLPDLLPSLRLHLLPNRAGRALLPNKMIKQKLLLIVYCIRGGRYRNPFVLL